MNIIDKENDTGNEGTKVNSVTIYAGFDPVPGTLKAKLNLLEKEVNEELYHNLKVSYKKIGSLTVATPEEEVKNT